MRVCLDECVLYGLVSLGRLAKVVKRNSRRAPLMPCDELGVTLPRLGVAPFGLQRLDGGRRRAVGFAPRDVRSLSSCHLITLPGCHRLPRFTLTSIIADTGGSHGIPLFSGETRPRLTVRPI
jgi:hypothetical protein